MNKIIGLICFTFIILVTLVTCFLCSNYKLSEKRERYSTFMEPSSLLSMEELSKIIKDRDLFDISIYYIPFSSESSEPLSENHVFDMGSLKITFDSVLPVYHAYLEDFLGDIVALQQNLPSYNDFRYCCLIRSKSDKFIRFSISKTSADTIFVNGQPYEVSYIVIESFLKLLPAKDYESAIEALGFIEK